MFDESANVLENEVPPDSERRRRFDLKTPTAAELLRDSPTDEDHAIWLKAGGAASQPALSLNYFGKKINK